MQLSSPGPRADRSLTELGEIPVNINESCTHVTLDNPYFPWPSKAHFLTSLLFSSARLPFSRTQKAAILNWAKELGALDVPTLYLFQKVTDSICEAVGNPSRKVTSSSGNVFYINDIANVIAKDYGNPLTRLAMQDYPEDKGKGMSQVFHGRKMLLDLPSPPAVRIHGRIFFVNELLQDTSGDYFIPERFFSAASNQSEGCSLNQTIPKTLKFVAALVAHPLREKAAGRMVYAVPLIIFMDDVSGNVSKQWNKHHAIYMSNANLPREMIDKEFCVRFVTSSPHASPMELMGAMKESICKAHESGIVAWDCKEEEEVLLIPYGLFVAGDNPMQAEECSHAGLSCNYFCRTCFVGGSKEYKESETGYNSLFVPGSPRTADKTVSTIAEHMELSQASGATDKLKKAMSSNGVRDTASSGIVETLVQLRKQLRRPGITNIHMDTPTEILHTVLLGIVKYFWGQTVFLLEKAHSLDIFQSRLDSVEKDGLNVMPFLIYDLVPKVVLDGWTVIGELVVLIWHTNIADTEEYLAGLTRSISDFLNITSQCAPSILISKPKFHFLIHLPAYIRRFGPAIVFSTERYESFNHVFRLSCIHSNRQAPSKDSCETFARQDAVKHIVTGGFWLDPQVKKWVRAAKNIRMYLAQHLEQARLLGIDVRDASSAAGEHEMNCCSHIKTFRWAETRCGSSLDVTNNGVYLKAKSFMASNGEQVKLGAHVIFRHPRHPKNSLGQVQEILLPSEGERLVKFVALQIFSVSPTLHPLIHLPMLQLTGEEVVTSGFEVS
ncbi:hypothetical protein PAXINDRAFT_81387 [Paxillus involutus ATCC 200175]|uniref:Uncharacterized protein n=1 Tax=Paxillus involutus ATCC 200175 TaxID=664439 RepID=A0A0C9TCG9_PAXIN|nr:hypothetical protein PAXINDRAFT_81387 [Paxillus involutus ATCC 200175]